MLRFVLIGAVLVVPTGCFGGSDPNAPTRSPGFKVLSTPLDLPERCAPDAVEARVVDAAEAFNEGRAGSFSAGFIENGQLSPYGVGGRGYVGDEPIEGFVTERHEAGDGWTLTELLPPRGRDGSPNTAPYGIGLVVQQGAAFRQEEGAKVVIDCTSGLIRAWVGPAFGPPASR